MNRSFPLVAVVGVVLLHSAHAQNKPDFTGTWKLDAAKSDPLPAGRGAGRGADNLTIKQVGDDMLIVREGRQGPQMMTYKLDGSESTNIIARRGGETQTKSKAKWDGSNLVIETTRPLAGTPITTKEVRKLDDTGREMEVETVVQTPQGE